MTFADFAMIRFGAGLSPRFAGPADADELLQSLGDKTAQQRFAVMSTAEFAVLRREYQTARSKRSSSKAATEEYQDVQRRIKEYARQAQRMRLARGIDNPIGFTDRLALFWASHFSIYAASHVPSIMVSTFHDDAIRAHQTGRFADLLKAATMHPAMLNYLDQTLSTGPNSVAAQRAKPDRRPGLNENHARELLELYTLGVGGGYTQADVRQLAELMTGLVINKDYEFAYQPRRAEPGAETVLGVEYGGADPAQLAEIEAFLDDIAVHPRTAAFICGKLARHFCADQPPETMVRAMTARFDETGGDLMAVYEVMVKHPEATETFGQKLRQPMDLLIAGLRALGIEGQQIADLKLGTYRRVVERALTRMGQPLTGASQPEGWPEEAEAWLGPQSLAARIDWAMDMARMMVKGRVNVQDVAQVALGPAATEVVPIIRRAETVQDAVGLVLASPQFNRR